MRKFLFVICLMALIAGCEKNKKEIPLTELNISKIISYIDQSPESVKSSFTDGELTDETETLGKTSLRYKIRTQNGDYSITFDGNIDNKIDNISISGLINGDYSKGINTFKFEMDKIHSSVSYYSYVGYYNSFLAGEIIFTDRNEFWNYVTERDVDSEIMEFWRLSDSPNIFFDVEGTYIKSSNAIYIEISKDVWEI